MNRNIPIIGDKFQSYKVISSPYLLKNKWYVDVECECGHKKSQLTGQLKKLTSCKKCVATKFRKYNIGEKRNNLTLIEYIQKNNHTQVKVLCDCGNIGLISSYHFGKIKTCRKCFDSLKGPSHRSYKGTKNITGTYFSQIKHNAKKRKLVFDLDIKFLDKLIIQQKYKCYLSGRSISIHDKSASLDRINSDKGYTQDNVMWIHKDVNRMKSDFDLLYFLELCNSIAKNEKN